jgi:hypothetical protein
MAYSPLFEAQIFLWTLYFGLKAMPYARVGSGADHFLSKLPSAGQPATFIMPTATLLEKKLYFFNLGMMNVAAALRHKKKLQTVCIQQ